jgi:hypothetical protein
VTEKPRNTLLGCLKVALLLVLLMFLMFAGAVGWGIYANDRMQAEATAFCSAVKPGQDIASVLERARGDGAPSRSSHDGDVYRFHWQGWVFNAHECVVTTAAGRVVSAQHVAHED